LVKVYRPGVGLGSCRKRVSGGSSQAVLIRCHKSGKLQADGSLVYTVGNESPAACSMMMLYGCMSVVSLACVLGWPVRVCHGQASRVVRL
jgi:hypothetical protein